MSTDYYSYVIFGVNLRDHVKILPSETSVQLKVNNKLAFDKDHKPIMRTVKTNSIIVFNGTEFETFYKFDNYLRKLGLMVFSECERKNLRSEDIYLGANIIESCGYNTAESKSLSFKELKKEFESTKELLKSININEEPKLLLYSTISW